MKPLPRGTSRHTGCLSERHVAKARTEEACRSATRRYDKGAEQAAKNPEHVKKAAEKAAEALQGPEGQALREAEERGKKHQHQ